MERNRGATARRVAELLVRTALTNFSEAKLDENSNDLIGFENGEIAHNLSDGDVLNPNKL